MVDGCANCVTTSDVRATRCGAVEHQAGQVRSHGALDDIGSRLIPTRDGVQGRHIDTSDLRLSHTR